jgi:hypothetical protein
MASLGWSHWWKVSRNGYLKVSRECPSLRQGSRLRLVAGMRQGISRVFKPGSCKSFPSFFFLGCSFSLSPPLSLFFSPVFCRPLPPTSLTSLGPCLPPLFRSVYSSRFGSSAPMSICGRWVLSKNLLSLISLWERDTHTLTHTEKGKEKRRR